MRRTAGTGIRRWRTFLHSQAVSSNSKPIQLAIPGTATNDAPGHRALSLISVAVAAAVSRAAMSRLAW